MQTILQIIVGALVVGWGIFILAAVYQFLIAAAVLCVLFMVLVALSHAAGNVRFR